MQTVLQSAYPGAMSSKLLSPNLALSRTIRTPSRQQHGSPGAGASLQDGVSRATGPALRILLLAVWVAASPGAYAQAVTEPSRGQLLYTTHCIACHSTQVHWRNDRRVTHWQSLLVQVRRWQAQAQLQWSDADIAAVARHLNDTVYKFGDTTARLAPPG